MVARNQVPTHALSLTQPWASLVACAEKRIETRSWPTKFRGLVAIHAAKGFPRDARALTRTHPFQSALRRADVWTGEDGALPLGAVVGVVRLTDCWRFGDLDDVFSGHAHAQHEAAFGDFTEGRYGFALAEIVALPRPIPARGALGFWQLPEDVREVLRKRGP
jgi:hypothetical protein